MGDDNSNVNDIGRNCTSALTISKNKKIKFTLAFPVY